MAIGDTFEGLAEDAKKLPWWGWVAIGGVVFLVAKNYLGGGGATTPTSSPDTSTDTSTVEPDGDETPGGGPAPTGTGTGTSSGGSGGPSAGGGGTGTKHPTDKLPSGGGGSKKVTSEPYIVVSGDTLYEIASKEHVDEAALYSKNQGIIESTAKAHGFSSSDHGHWIFPGEKLIIPA